MIEQYIQKKLNEAGMIPSILSGVVYNMAVPVVASAGMGLFGKIKAIYNQNKYDKKDCSMILDPDERLKCELYTKTKISQIRLNYLQGLLKASKDEKETDELNKYISKEQRNLMKYAQSLSSM